MKVLSQEEAKFLDSWAETTLGIPRIALMETAGAKVAEVTLREVKLVESACIVAGKGWNAGDGFVSARYLKNSGVDVNIVLLYSKDEIKDEARINLNIAEKMGIPIYDVKELKRALKDVDVVIDAIFGIGFKGEAEGSLAEAIETINEGRSLYTIVSIDTPSGLDVGEGRVSKHCIKANITVTLSFPKIGLLQYPGIEHAGKIVIVDIGIPKINPLNPPVKKEEQKKAKKEGLNIITPDIVHSIIPKRPVLTHKGTFGEVLVIASSPGMTGAATLCGRGALRVGAGLVRIAVPISLRETVDSESLETITIGLPETADGTISMRAFEAILELLKESDGLAIGPGIGRQPETAKLIQSIVSYAKEKGIKTVIDADAIFALRDKKEAILGSHGGIILTPHPGELSYFLNMEIEEIQKNRQEIAKKVAKDLDIILVLKGAYTVVANPEGEVFINITGNPGMASAGVGDVLTGAIVGFLAQGVPTFRAAIASVYIHGMAGDVVRELKGEHGIIAGDILEGLPYVIEGALRRK